MGGEMIMRCGWIGTVMHGGDEHAARDSAAASMASAVATAGNASASVSFTVPSSSMVSVTDLMTSATAPPQVLLTGVGEAE